MPFTTVRTKTQIMADIKLGLSRAVHDQVAIKLTDLRVLVGESNVRKYIAAEYDDTACCKSCGAHVKFPVDNRPDLATLDCPKCEQKGFVLYLDEDFVDSVKVVDGRREERMRLVSVDRVKLLEELLRQTAPAKLAAAKPAQ